jgi:hypothetical protein
MPKAKRKGLRRPMTSSPGVRVTRTRAPATLDRVAPSPDDPNWLETLADKVAEKLRPTHTPPMETTPASVAGATLLASTSSAPVAGATTPLAPTTSLVNDAARHLLGESPTRAAVAAPPAPLSSPLGAHISASIRAQIWGGQYVAMSDLKPPTDPSSMALPRLALPPPLNRRLPLLQRSLFRNFSLFSIPLSRFALSGIRMRLLAYSNTSKH